MVEEFDADDFRKFSSFVLDDVFQSKENIKEKLEKFQKDLDEEFDDIEERIFVQNIISYLQWRLEEREEALTSLKIAEEMQKRPHLITHCNKLLFYTEFGEHFYSKQLSKDLKSNDHFKQKETRSQATAEIAYCYSRLGPKYHDSAVKLFKEAIANITPDRNILWEFRLALTLRRQSHMFQMTTPEKFKPAEKIEEAARLLNEIVKLPSNDYRYIKARAWCELGKILFKGKHLFEIIHTDSEETEKINEKWCFAEAMTLYPNQNTILQEYGRYLRYTNDLETSKEMLEKAVKLKDTIFARHHLALTLKRMVEVANPKALFGNKFQYPCWVDESGQSKNYSWDFNQSNMSKGFDSFSDITEHKVDKSIHCKCVQYKSTFTLALNERSKSMDSVIYSENDFRKDDTLPSEIRFIVPKFEKVSTSPLKIQSHSASQKDDQSMSYQKREQKNPFYHNQADLNYLKRIFISSRKSPKSVCVSSNNSLLLEAVEHLQKAIEMSTRYEGTRYELGLIYRMLDRPDDALKCFSFITSSSCGNLSDYPMYLINAYEQQALCKLDLLAKENDTNKKNALQYDAKKCTWKALSVVSRVIGALPMLKRTTLCFQTLKELLQNEDDSSRKFRELAKLHELLDYDRESIRFYKEIIKEDSDSTTVRKLVQMFVKIEDFENAICTLSLLQGTSEVNISDKCFYVDTCIKGAKHSLLKGDDLDIAKIRFSEAYKTIFSHQNESTPSYEKDENLPHIIVLHSCGVDECCYQKFITSSLKTFVQIKFVVNDDDCPASRRRFEYLMETMCESNCIIIFHHQCISGALNKDEFIDRAMEMACVKHKAKIIRIRTQEVEQYAPECKDIVLTCGQSDVNNDYSNLLKGNLLFDILHKLSEMYLGESVDFRDGN